MTSSIRFPIGPEFDSVWRPLGTPNTIETSSESIVASESTTDVLESTDPAVLKQKSYHAAIRKIQEPALLSFSCSNTDRSASVRLGCIADWTAQSSAMAFDGSQRRGGSGQSAGAFRNSRVVTSSTKSGAAADVSSGWQYVAPEIKGSSSSGPTTSSSGHVGGGSGASSNQHGAAAGARRSAGGNFVRNQRKGGGWGPRFNIGGSDRGHYQGMGHRKRDASVLVQADWSVMEDIEFNRLAKLQADVGEAECLTCSAPLADYDSTMDKSISCRNEHALPSLPSSVTAMLAPCAPESSHFSLLNDSTIAELLTKASEAPSAVINAAVAATLMASQRTVIPWDLLIHKRDGIIYIDRRPESTIEMLTVNETYPGDGSPMDDAVFAFNQPMRDKSASVLANAPINSARMLACELVSVRQQSIQLLKAGGSSSTSTTVPSVDRYTLVEVGAGCPVLARSSVHLQRAPDAPIMIVPLLEYSHKVVGSSHLDWRRMLDKSRGAVMAQEIRNNSSMLSRCVFHALLAGIDTIKVVFVSRQIASDMTKHVVLGVQEFEPLELAAQMNLNVANGFGVLRAIIDLCTSRLGSAQSADCLLMRDPNKALLRLFRVPHAKFVVETLSHNTDNATDQMDEDNDAADILLLPDDPSAMVLAGDDDMDGIMSMDDEEEDGNTSQGDDQDME